MAVNATLITDSFPGHPLSSWRLNFLSRQSDHYTGVCNESNRDHIKLGDN